jgi:rare lipoprotein A
MNPYYAYLPYVNRYYNQSAANDLHRFYGNYYQKKPGYYARQQPIRGQATWTEGGPATQCGIPWSDNEYMTAAVGTNAPYRCGQMLEIRNTSSPSPKEILVKVVDRVQGYPANRINLHRRAFTALGANPNQGVINIEIMPSPQVEPEEWGKYLMAVTQAAYPGYNVVDYKLTEKTELSPTQTRQTYEFTLQSPQERIRVQGNILYNPTNDRVISFDINELPAR